MEYKYFLKNNIWAQIENYGDYLCIFLKKDLYLKAV